MFNGQNGPGQGMPTKEVYEPQEPSPPRKKRKEMPEDMKAWFLKEYPGPEGCKVRIHSVGGDNYRVNYWEEIEKKDCFNKDNRITHSMYITVLKTGDSFDLIRK